MKTLIKTILPATLLSTGLFGAIAIGMPNAASARTIVTCGPNGAAAIVEVVPAGCRVLSAASPPKQAGNVVQKSRLGFYFNAAGSQPGSINDAIAATESQPTLVGAAQSRLLTR